MSATRVGVSLLYLSPERIAGVATYTFGVLRALLERRRFEYVLFVPRPLESMWRTWLGDRPAVIVPCGPHPDRRVQRVLFEQIALPRLARAHGVASVLFPHTIAPRWTSPGHVVTVHDLMALSKRTDFSPHKLAYIRWTYRQLARRVRHFVTVSAFTRDELRERLGVPPERVVIAPNALDAEFLDGRPAAPYEGPALPDHYLLSVGGTFPHKRLHVVVDVFRALATRDRQLHLVMCGTFTGSREGREALEAYVAECGFGGRIHLLPRLPRVAFPHLYARAACLVSASEFEGFGIPLIEAMAMGCPVAASPAAGALETLGGHGHAARDFSTDALREAVQAALGAREARAAELDRARAFVRSRYTWDSAAAVVEQSLAASAAPHAAARESHASGPRAVTSRA